MAGSQDNFIDTQNAILANTTVNITYTQLTDLTFNLDSILTRHQLTNDTIDNIFSLSFSDVSGNMWLTTTEWSILQELLVDVNGIRPIKTWSITWTDQSSVVKTTTFLAQLKTLTPIDSGIGAIKLFFNLILKESVIVS